MEHTTYTMTEEELQRIAYITHIHEAAAKSKEIHKMLALFYKKICAVAKLNGVQLSTLRIPYHRNEEVFYSNFALKENRQEEVDDAKTT